MRSARSRSISSIKDHATSSEKMSSDDVSDEIHHSRTNKNGSAHISNSASNSALKTFNQNKNDDHYLEASSKRFERFEKDNFNQLFQEKMSQKRSSSSDPNNANDEVENIFESLIIAMSETSSQNSFTCALAGVEPMPKTESRAYQHFTYEREVINSEKDLDDFQYYFMGVEKPKKRRGMDSSRIAPFNEKFREWELAGKSYRIIPIPPRLRTYSTSMDFFSNTEYKAFMSGSEYLVPEFDTEMCYMDSQLEQTRQLDELTIDYLKYRNSLIRRTKIGPGNQLSSSIDSLVRKKEKCDHMIRVINDDHISEYRPFVFIRPNTIYTIPFPTISRETLAKLSFLLVVIDANILKSPEYALSHCIAKTIKILLTIEKEKPNLPFHLIVPTSAVIFMHLFMSMISRLEEYTNDPQFFTLFAAYDVLGLQFNVPLMERDLKRLNKNIKDGGCLAKLYFELKNSATNLIVQKVLEEFETGLLYLTGKKDADHYHAHERIYFNGRKLSAMTFKFDENIISCKVEEPTEMMAKFCRIPIMPPYDASNAMSAFGHQNFKMSDSDQVGYFQDTYQREGLSFTPKVSAHSTSKKANSLQFKPESYDFFFNLA